jgi:hypothetical protein
VSRTGLPILGSKGRQSPDQHNGVSAEDRSRATRQRRGDFSGTVAGGQDRHDKIRFPNCLRATIRANRMSDRSFRDANEWSLASDGIQWILQRRRQKNGRVSWRPVSFVRSTRAILARCMREKGVPTADAEQLLAGLPPTFDEWLQASRSWSETLNAPSLAPTTDLVDEAETSDFGLEEQMNLLPD